MKKDIVELIFGKHAHLNPSGMLNISDLRLSSFFVHRKKTLKKFPNFFPHHANELNIPNILKYASDWINSFIYLNKLLYIIEFIILMYYIVQTFEQNSFL